MPATVTRLPDEPILVATLTGKFTAEDAMEVFRRSTELINDEDGIIYRITDAREADSTLPEMMQTVKVAAAQSGATTGDPRINVILVGKTTWLNFMRNNMQTRGVELGLVTDFDLALETARIQIAAFNEKQSVL